MRSGPKTLTEDWEYSIKSLLVPISIVWRVMIPLSCSKYKKRWEWKCLKVWFFFYHDHWGSKGTMRHVRVSIFQIHKVTKIGITIFLHRNKLNYPHILYEVVNLYVMFNQC